MNTSTNERVATLEKQIQAVEHNRLVQKERIDKLEKRVEQLELIVKQLTK